MIEQTPAGTPDEAPARPGRRHLHSRPSRAGGIVNAIMALAVALVAGAAHEQIMRLIAPLEFDAYRIGLAVVGLAAADVAARSILRLRLNPYTLMIVTVGGGVTLFALALFGSPLA
ncbi:hypothetical protein JOL79_06725 [Microbispora sp. RL4-1S]|uniref:Uncharacterized protein n=1 Tax=Microbispora oryzae TaxID=2806554 RepID=A0A940WLX7_9ACTN|nr:hypothetical protein [Microbispora oryzae]MBP2703491.1 hypothetical protein [Microbispora oryzae]